jgi:hypothetical protein
MVGWLRKSEVEKVQKEAVVSYVKVPSPHLPGLTEEIQEETRSLCPRRDSKGGRSESIRKHYC